MGTAPPALGHLTLLIFLVFLLLLRVMLVLSARDMGASRLTAGPRAREPSLRWRWSRPCGLCPLARLPIPASFNSLAELTPVPPWPLDTRLARSLPQRYSNLSH